MLNRITTYVFIIALLFGNTSYANPDKDQPFFLESDSAKWDEESQKSTYHGNVIVTQGSLLITGDLLIVTSKNGEIVHMVVTGNKSTYKQKTKTGKIVNGEAIKIEYHIDQFKIIFIDKAIITQSNNILKNDKIIYKTDSENVIAGDSKDGSRVRMTIKPKKNNE